MAKGLALFSVTAALSRKPASRRRVDHLASAVSAAPALDNRPRRGPTPGFETSFRTVPGTSRGLMRCLPGSASRFTAVARRRPGIAVRRQRREPPALGPSPTVHSLIEEEKAMPATEMALMPVLLVAWTVTVFVGVPKLDALARQRVRPGVKEPDWIDALLYATGFLGSTALVSVALMALPALH